MTRSTLPTSAPLSDATLRTLLEGMRVGVTDCILNAPGLAIGTAKAKVLIPAVYALFNGVLKVKASAEVVLTTAANVTADKFNVLVFSMSSAGAVTTHVGTEADTLAAVLFPTITSGNLPLGMVILNPTGTGNFVGGTTELDDATVVPNAVYVDFQGSFNPAAFAL